MRQAAVAERATGAFPGMTDESRAPHRRGHRTGRDSQGEGGLTSFVAPIREEVARPFPQLENLGFIGQGGTGARFTEPGRRR